MKLNKELLNKFKNTDSKLIAVTKYLDKTDTIDVINQIEQDYIEIIEGFGENRLDSLKEKEIDREKLHFIGNIQSKQIKEIVKYASVIHSLDDMKHLKKMEDICSKQGNWVQVFLQINIDESKPGGVKSEKIPEFLDVIGEMENVSLIGFSAIGKSEFTKQEKEAEFDFLISLRNKYLQNGFISAGTSRDYEIALEKGIDFIRIGTNLYN